jgi:hypothetical protein
MGKYLGEMGRSYNTHENKIILMNEDNEGELGLYVKWY